METAKRQAKKSFAISLLIMLSSTATEATSEIVELARGLRNDLT